MLNTNYAKLVGGYLEYLRLPIQLAEPMTIGEVTHPAGAHLSTNDDAAIKELGYKPVTRTAMPTREGYYYTEKWTETDTAIVQEWEEHEQSEDELTDAVTALETLGYTEDSNG